MTITVYEKENCPQCKLTQKVLDQKGLKYQKRNALEHLDTLREMGFASAPVVVVEGTKRDSWAGFQPGRIAALVE